MNHRTLTIAATIGLLAFTSCSAQQRQMIQNIREDDKTPSTVVDQASTVVAVPSKVSATTVTVPCGETGGADCPQPASPPTTVYSGPPLMQCSNGSFAIQGECPPPATQP